MKFFLRIIFYIFFCAESFFARCVGGKHASSSGSLATLMPEGCIAAASAPTPGGGWTPREAGDPHSSHPRTPRNHQIMILCVYYKTPYICPPALPLGPGRGIQFTNYKIYVCVRMCIHFVRTFRINYLLVINFNWGVINTRSIPRILYIKIIYKMARLFLSRMYVCTKYMGSHFALTSHYLLSFKGSLTRLISL